MFPLNDWRRRSIGIELVRVLGLLNVEELFFKNNLTALGVNGNGGQFVAFSAACARLGVQRQKQRSSRQLLFLY